MTGEEKRDRIVELALELTALLREATGDSERLRERLEFAERARPREALETMPASHGAVLDGQNASDAAIAQFLLLETPIAIPSDFAGARELFRQLASEAELVGRRANFGHCWRVRLGDNGEFRIWTLRDGRVERVEYATTQ